MKPPPFTYHDPSTVDEALGLLAQHENARLLAGGQSLMPMLNFRFVMPDHVVDLNRVAGIDEIRVHTDRLVFGAMARQRSIEHSAEVRAACPILGASLAHVGHRQTRNRGTIGGSLCHLDPSAELAHMACLYDARLSVRSRTEERTLSFAEFAQGYLTTALAENELLTRIELARWPQAHGYGFEEVARRRGDFAIAMASALLALDGAGRIARAALCVSGVGPVPARLSSVEQSLVGQSPDAALFKSAAVEAEQLEAMDDAYVSGRYRKHLARVLVHRVLEKAVANARNPGAGHG